ncbi:heterokaryon incompatibility protein-domain-containing protein [Pyrenochaeta sp. MPI-SDFR-AT-0127]|nr:heterokaryon incompatibility protein-domain-containing protein [Pyrenochaeta sp. MPI-SDFR-AT-0127]
MQVELTQLARLRGGSYARIRDDAIAHRPLSQSHYHECFPILSRLHRRNRNLQIWLSHEGQFVHISVAMQAYCNVMRYCEFYVCKLIHTWPRQVYFKTPVEWPFGFENQSPFDQRTPRVDLLCNQCFILVKSINEEAKPEWLEHKRPGTPPKMEPTGYSLPGLLGRCSLCLVFCALGSGLEPRMSRHKTSPDIARGTESIIPSVSLDNILITYDSSYHGQRSVEITEFDVQGNTGYANNLCFIERGRVLPETIRGWLSNCKEQHQSCWAQHHSSSSTKLSVEESLSINLIDVHNECLVSANVYEQFVALSYVWGGDQFKCLHENTAQLFTKGGLKAREKELSKVVKDAISLVKSLGVNYLWIDALCVCQDDEEEEKNKELAKMSAIYRHSYFTIFALTGTDANCPLPGVEPNSRHKLVYPNQKHPGLYLCKRNPSLVYSTAKALHSSRGWTFQESALSRRCLYFCEDQVYFQCQNAIWCEDRKSPLKEDLLRLKPMVHIIVSSMAGKDIATAEIFKVYWMMAYDYLNRNLTDPADVAKAFAYVAEELGRGWRFTHAIPENVIDVALMWTHSGSQAVRRDLGNRLPQDEDDSATHRTQVLQEPSWSWMGWKGGVNYELIVKWGGKLASLIPDFLIMDRADVRFAARTFLSQTPSQLGKSNERGVEARRNIFQAEANLQLLSGYDAMLIFPAESLSLGLFKLSASSVIWKPAGEKAFPTPVPQPLTRLIGASNRVCGVIYAWSKEIDNENGSGELKLIALSLLQHTPKISYVAVTIGTCWKDCCARAVCNEIFDPEHFCSREWAVLNFLVIRRTGSGDFWERVAIGQMHVDAWRAFEPPEMMVHLI